MNPTLLVFNIFYALLYYSLKGLLIYQALSLGFHLSALYEYTLLLGFLVPSSILGWEEIVFVCLAYFFNPSSSQKQRKTLFKALLLQV